MRMPNLNKQKLLPYAASAGLVIATTAFGELVKSRLEPTNIVVLYLLVVVICALRWGRGPAIAASIVGVLLFDFFLVPPYLTLSVASIQYIFTFIAFLVVGLVVSTLAASVREERIHAQKREAQASALYRLSDDLASAGTFEEALQSIRRNVGAIFDCDVALYLPAGMRLEPMSRDVGFPADEQARSIAQQAFESGASTGESRNTRPGGRIRYIPCKAPTGVLGVLGIRFRRKREALTADEEDVLHALASQAAVAIQRSKLAEENRQIELMRQAEKLHSALLSSISHDLRTPLVTVTGALATLLDAGAGLDDAQRRDLLENARAEAGRLDRLVGNLLDMTRMEAGALRISKRPCELRDVVGASLDLLKDKLGARTVTISIPRDFPEVPMDFSLMMKVFFNVLDNAVKYSPPDAPIGISARAAGDLVVIEVSDRGPGVPPADLKRIFEKFYRAEQPHRATGTGLGLSICKGIVEAHDGGISAANNPDGGATFTITMPLRGEASQS